MGRAKYLSEDFSFKGFGFVRGWFRGVHASLLHYHTSEYYGKHDSLSQTCSFITRSVLAILILEIDLTYQPFP